MSGTSTAILSANDLARRFGSAWALRSASFSVRSGEILGLIGPNGAGKTTLFDCVAGVAPASSGDVRLEGTLVPAEERKRFLFYLPDGMRPWAEHRVRWLLYFVNDVYGASETIDARIIDALGIRPLFASRLGTLSKGEHKRVMLAMALLSSQRLLLLDEPFDGLDLRQTRDAMSLLREECAKGRTLFLSIHQLADAARVCHRFVLLSAGQTVGEGTLDELRALAKLPSDRALEEVFLALT
jgi:ABC-2 type transport system ATP-binding protein